MAILLNPTNVNIEINDDIGLMCISEEFSNHAPRETYLIQSQYEAARAFFQAERDEQLGRWRDPESPNLVCYQRGDDTVYVLDERTGFTYARTRSDIIDGSDQYDIVADRYFAAHQQPEPKPWEDAQPGEFWILTVDEKTDPYKIWTDTQRVRRFERVERPYTTIYLNDPRITAGRRIWPEGEASE